MYATKVAVQYYKNTELEALLVDNGWAGFNVGFQLHNDVRDHIYGMHKLLIGVIRISKNLPPLLMLALVGK